MKATELRIGNLIHETGDGIQDPEIELVVVNSIEAGKNRWYVKNQEDELIGDDFLIPIKLTEEWLVKFGFTKKEKISYSYYYKYFKQTDTKGCEQDSKFSLGRNGTEVFINNVWICGIEYVHQLQNLYFALTEKELEIK